MSAAPDLTQSIGNSNNNPDLKTNVTKRGPELVLQIRSYNLLRFRVENPQTRLGVSLMQNEIPSLIRAEIGALIKCEGENNNNGNMNNNNKNYSFFTDVEEGFVAHKVGIRPKDIFVVPQPDKKKWSFGDANDIQKFLSTGKPFDIFVLRKNDMICTEPRPTTPVAVPGYTYHAICVEKQKDKLGAKLLVAHTPPSLREALQGIIADKGRYVFFGQVVPGGAAAKMGLEIGDILIVPRNQTWRLAQASDFVKRSLALGKPFILHVLRRVRSDDSEDSDRRQTIHVAATHERTAEEASPFIGTAAVAAASVPTMSRTATQNSTLNEVGFDTTTSALPNGDTHLPIQNKFSATDEAANENERYSKKRMLPLPHQQNQLDNLDDKDITGPPAKRQSTAEKTADEFKETHATLLTDEHDVTDSSRTNGTSMLEGVAKLSNDSAEKESALKLANESAEKTNKAAIDLVDLFSNLFSGEESDEELVASRLETLLADGDIIRVFTLMGGNHHTIQYLNHTKGAFWQECGWKMLTATIRHGHNSVEVVEVTILGLGIVEKFVKSLEHCHTSGLFQSLMSFGKTVLIKYEGLRTRFASYEGVVCLLFTLLQRRLGDTDSFTVGLELMKLLLARSGSCASMEKQVSDLCVQIVDSLQKCDTPEGFVMLMTFCESNFVESRSLLDRFAATKGSVQALLDVLIRRLGTPSSYASCLQTVRRVAERMDTAVKHSIVEEHDGIMKIYQIKREYEGAEDVAKAAKDAMLCLT